MRLLFLTMLLCLVMTGCSAKRTTFVLVPDPTGNVGKISVTNAQGTETLDQAGQSIVVNSESAAPGRISTLTAEQISSLFSKTMAIEPPQPAKFILYFRFDSTRLAAESKKTLVTVLETAAQGKSMDIAVNGHSDRAGDADYNYRLSLRRAEHIRQLLEKHDIDPTFITSTSHGEGNPLVPTDDNVYEPRNRRVEVIIR